MAVKNPAISISSFLENKCGISDCYIKLLSRLKILLVQLFSFSII